MYTKGKWSINKRGITYEIYCKRGDKSDYKVAERIYNKANAHLIAAAPSLYEALKYIIRALDEANVIKATSIFMEMPNKALAKVGVK